MNTIQILLYLFFHTTSPVAGTINRPIHVHPVSFAYLPVVVIHVPNVEMIINPIISSTYHDNAAYIPLINTPRLTDIASRLAIKKADRKPAFYLEQHLVPPDYHQLAPVASLPKQGISSSSPTLRLDGRSKFAGIQAFFTDPLVPPAAIVDGPGMSDL
jgi:hypothetical protein